MAVQTVSNVASAIFGYVQSVYGYLTYGEVVVSEKYSVLRHSRPFVFYRATKTTVPISIFGSKPLPKKRRVFLQKRGYRTGLFGWTIGSMLGGSKLPGIEVTPETIEKYTNIPAGALRGYEKDIDGIWKPYELDKHQNQTHLETMEVHIPVESGDGYFRLRVTPHDKPRETIAASPVFRVGSLNWASASPQGASLLGLAPELVVRSAFITAHAAMWAGFYATFPIFKLVNWTPTSVQTFVARNAYQFAGGPDPRVLDERYKVKERVERMKQAQENFNKKIPYGMASIRTIYDLQKDEELGRQGVAYVK